MKLSIKAVSYCLQHLKYVAMPHYFEKLESPHLSKVTKKCNLKITIKRWEYSPNETLHVSLRCPHLPRTCTFVVVGLGRRHDGSKIVVSVDALRSKVGVQPNSRRTCLSTDLAWVACGAPDSCCLLLFSFGFQRSNAF